MPKNSNKRNQKQQLLSSDAFPPNKRGYREKIYASSSSHTLLKGIKINPEEIIYKPLSLENLEETKKLHKEWFPIDYSDNYFEKIFNKKNFWYFTVGAFYNYIDEEKKEKKEILLGLAFCEWMYVSKYFINHTNKDIIKKICRNIDYNEEVQSYIKCEDYRCVYIMTIGVLDEYRKMNIGTNIINEIINIALTDNLCVGIYLDVIYYNQSAIKFYKKNNFEKVSTIRNYYNLNGNKYDSYVFLRIFTRKEKDEFRQKNRTMLEKFVNFLIISPMNFLIKIILFIVLFQCFRNKIKID